mgnify:CR=1 FL=1
MTDQTTTIAQIKSLIEGFRKKRGWTKEDPKDIALSLVLESAELLEHFQWLKGEDVEKNQRMKEAIGEEMSDVLWWLANLGQKLGIDMAEAFEQKMKEIEVKKKDKEKKERLPKILPHFLQSQVSLCL